jgi:hypothetical protein
LAAICFWDGGCSEDEIVGNADISAPLRFGRDDKSKLSLTEIGCFLDAGWSLVGVMSFGWESPKWIGDFDGGLVTYGWEIDSGW